MVDAEDRQAIRLKTFRRVFCDTSKLRNSITGAAKRLMSSSSVIRSTRGSSDRRRIEGNLIYSEAFRPMRRVAIGNPIKSRYVFTLHESQLSLIDLEHLSALGENRRTASEG